MLIYFKQYLTGPDQCLNNSYRLREYREWQNVMGELENVRRHFAGTWFLALIWKFLNKFDNINSIFHLDKLSADNKCWNRFLSEILSL